MYVTIQFFQHNFLKRLSSPCFIFLAVFSLVKWPHMCMLMLSILFHCFFVCFNVNTILYWWQWLCNIVWNQEAQCLQLCCSFLKIALAVWGPSGGLFLDSGYIKPDKLVNIIYNGKNNKIINWQYTSLLYSVFVNINYGCIIHTFIYICFYIIYNILKYMYYIWHIYFYVDFKNMINFNF